MHEPNDTQLDGPKPRAGLPEDLRSALKYRNWRARLDAEGVAVKAVEPLHIVRRGNGEVLFAMLDTHLVSPEGFRIPRIAVLSGAIVTVVVGLRAAETGAEYLLLVRQRRIADGSLMYEHPCGMCDADPEPRRVALRELWEETGLEAQDAELVPLFDRPLYPSPGLLDEHHWFFAIRRTLPLAQIEALEGRQRGEVSESEFITTHVVPLAAAPNIIGNTNGVLAWFLYRQHFDL